MSTESEHDVTSGAGLSRRRVVLEAIRLRDTAGARQAMGRLLDLAAEDLHVDP